MRANYILAGVATAGALLFAPACNDEDGDGAVTDEEVQDQVDEEIEGQDEGTNDNSEDTTDSTEDNG